MYTLSVTRSRQNTVYAFLFRQNQAVKKQANKNKTKINTTQQERSTQYQ